MNMNSEKIKQLARECLAKLEKETSDRFELFAVTVLIQTMILLSERYDKCDPYE